MFVKNQKISTQMAIDKTIEIESQMAFLYQYS